MGTSVDVAPSTDEVRRRELAAFLRSRRERISPQQAGVVHYGRRRTPGLRREEVAQLSGVGVTWYTWLEQGRDIKVSDQVLEAVARTLLLDRDEHAHLFTLAGSAEMPVPRDCGALSAQQQAVLDKLDPYPACVQNAKYDVLGYNQSYRFLITDLDAIPVEDRNCLWLLFTNERWRKTVIDWQDVAATMVANLRALAAEHAGDRTWDVLINRMRAASPAFVAMWDRHEVRGITNKVKRYRNQHVGMLRLTVTNNWLAPAAGSRMLVYVPDCAETERRLIALQELRAAEAH